MGTLSSKLPLLRRIDVFYNSQEDSSTRTFLGGLLTIAYPIVLVAYIVYSYQTLASQYVTTVTSLPLPGAGGPIDTPLFVTVKCVNSLGCFYTEVGQILSLKARLPMLTVSKRTTPRSLLVKNTPNSGQLSKNRSEVATSLLLMQPLSCQSATTPTTSMALPLSGIEPANAPEALLPTLIIILPCQEIPALLASRFRCLDWTAAKLQTRAFPYSRESTF